MDAEEIFKFIGFMTAAIVSVLIMVGIVDLIKLIIDSNSILKKLQDKYLEDK